MAPRLQLQLGSNNLTCLKKQEKPTGRLKDPAIVINHQQLTKQTVALIGLDGGKHAVTHLCLL